MSIVLLMVVNIHNINTIAFLLDSNDELLLLILITVIIIIITRIKKICNI